VQLLKLQQVMTSHESSTLHIEVASDTNIYIHVTSIS